MPAYDAEQLENRKVLSLYAKIHGIVHAKYKAVIGAHFAPSVEPVTLFLEPGGKMKNGVCRALVNQWLEDHVAEGSPWNRPFVKIGDIAFLKPFDSRTRCKIARRQSGAASRKRGGSHG